MHAVVGTVPEKDFPLVCGVVELKGGRLNVEGRSVPINRGTTALIGASAAAGKVLGAPPVFAFLAGDIGLGNGSRRLYEFLSRSLADFDFEAITFHYLLPDVDWHTRVLFALEKMRRRPALIADAGFMYAAKMSGESESYDLFTPDAGELAFLADEDAPHPFYTRGFILHDSNRVPDLIRRAYRHRNAARYLLVKGESDFFADSDGILSTVGEPSIEAMEAIGGTGDTLTGLVAALIASGRSIPESAVIAARANRWAGFYAEPTPATWVLEIIDQIPKGLERALRDSPESRTGQN
jgi:ADP-dependent NAD(P)H-hydrate dehydratase / NAD(P)H-hydrate epimerase